jgi:predicted dehydrogenase
MTATERIRIGVLGCSRIAKRSVFQAIRNSSNAQLVIIGSRDAEKARERAQQFGCSSGSYEDVLASDIDAVYVSLPNTLHEEWVIKAARSGKHVWCEKPAAITYRSAKKMVVACKKAKVRLMEGFMFRYHPQHAKVKDLIKSGIIGDVFRIEAFFAFPMPEGGNILNAQLGGGAYYDAMPYPIAASRMIFGEEPLRALSSIEIDAVRAIPTRADMILQYPEGKTALVSSAFGSYYQSYYRVVGSKGYIRTERAFPVPVDREVKIVVGHDDAEDSFSIPAADHFQLMVEDFCEEMARGKNGTKKYEEDLLAQARVLDAGIESFKKGKAIKL